MELKVECVRDLMIAIEENVKVVNMQVIPLTFEEICKVPKLQKALKKNYSRDDVVYTSLMLSQGGFADILFINTDSNYIYPRDYLGLKYPGHEFLNSVRSDDIWNKTKTTASKLGIFTITALKDIAVQFGAEVVKSSFIT